MNHALRRLIAARPLPLARGYSAVLPPTAQKKWGLAGMPRPRSILDDDDAPVDLSEDNEAVNGARPDTPPIHARSPPAKPTPSEWQQHRATMKKNFPDGWSPPRKLSREAMEGIRQMHRFNPEQFTTALLAEKFKISPEAVRRILKSKWQPSKEKMVKLAARERKGRMDAIVNSRLRERGEAQQLAELRKGGRDKLTFE
ncbi:hypothetical protein AX16_005702 [Volvariella volvacea WC 439]|nr:hypothetical protein AX16_005702 [Volvariella volvacea WC 439]